MGINYEILLAHYLRLSPPNEITIKEFEEFIKEDLKTQPKRALIYEGEDKENELARIYRIGKSSLTYTKPRQWKEEGASAYVKNKDNSKLIIMLEGNDELEVNQTKTALKKKFPELKEKN